MSGGFVEVIAEIGPINRQIDNSDYHLDFGTYYPTMSDTYLKGGFRIMSSLSHRDAIPATAKKLGMVVYVPASGYYEWNGSSWIPWSVAAAGFPFATRRDITTGPHSLASVPYNYDCFADTGTAASSITYTLPVTPIDGQRVRVRDYTGTATALLPIVLDSSASPGGIFGSGGFGATLSVVSAYGWTEVVWNSASGAWYQSIQSSSGGGTVGPGTPNRIAIFDGAGTNVTDSNLSQDGSGNLSFVLPANLLPDPTNACEIGTDSAPFQRIRAVEVVSGDHVFDNPDLGVTIRVMEHQDHMLVFRNEKNGKLYRIPWIALEEEDSDG